MRTRTIAGACALAWIATAAGQAFCDIRDKYGIANSFEIYAGTHTSKLADRFRNHVMPFFSANLSFEPARK